MTSNGAVQATQLSLQLASGRSLTIEESELVLQDPATVDDRKSKKYRCGRQTIPLYNLLWAEAVEDNFTIEYAQLSDKSFHVGKWTLPISTTDERSESSPETFATELRSRAYGDAQQRRRTYVLVNPNAGPGNGIKRWQNEVKPIFDAARMEMDIVFLKKGGEAMELVEQMDIHKYDTIIPCSGDGTPHEVFNGLAKRPDARLALSKIAVGHIPCGSGNAMSCNLYGSHKPSYAALALVKGVVTPLDLVSITQGNARIISFLSQSLGVVAEGDLATEHLRWMGSARFDYGVISRVFRKKVYPCDIAVQLEVEKPQVKEHYKRHASVPSLRKAAAEQADEDEGNGLPKLRFGTIKDDLPVGWELVPYDKVGTFYCGNMAYMAPDVHFFPAAMATDGCMDLITMNGDIPTFKALKAFLSVDSNKFFDLPYVHYKKVKAYRIIPRDQKDGYISIDGEKVPFEPFQAEVHQGLGRVISKRGMFEAEGPANWDKVTVSERLHA
ncbi:sphingosine kinase [Cordyceps fumosorosea ARSEF 2679]|uniref:Sphingosine kinase n=1 Tax=Cordyceps fumosorosea (strain ARSEF 2679) TaxID=1081104 RepID=A0A162I6R9_CORFA|nr:sphingosine kinase [Cordyceps fumosorosea ARSEF 2679]OAA53055.1 sphingosine kinase [Cordyceps fumosorosea ARSEF 2679]